MKSRTYATRSSAVRAARNECRKRLGKGYQAFEGPDYIIHPAGEAERISFPRWWRYSEYTGASRFELRGPATSKED